MNNNNTTLAGAGFENGAILGMWVGRGFDEDVQYVIRRNGALNGIYRHQRNTGTNNWEWVEIKSPDSDETKNTHFGDANCTPDKQYFIKTGPYKPYCVTADPDNPEHVWVGFGGITDWNIPPEPTGRVMYSANGGTTWCDVSRGLPIFGVTKIVYQEGTDDVLYAATDAGVYVWDKYYANATGPDGRWLCFSHNLPNCAITDLEIAQCEGKLRVGMWGRGIWQTDLPKIPAARIRYQEIAANTTWASSRAVNENMVVKSGATLTINNGAVIRLAKNVTITIEPGAKLVADGATLTNACGAMWGGIIVQGSKTLPQDLSSHNNATATSTNQGFVYLNNATIENAYEALRIWNPADGWVQSDDVSAQGGTGGIVRAVNTTFRNNRRSAEFMWYRGFVNGLEKDNLSYFYNCTFTTDDNHRMQHLFHAHVTAWGVRGIKFLGCTFENASTVTEQTSATKLGNGIVTIDAGITVGDYNPSLSIGGNNLRRSEFKNLEHGVYIMEENSIYSTIVTHAKFENCIRAIRNEGVNLCRFTGNEFILGGNPATIPPINGQIQVPTEEGIILHGNMNGFIVEQNKFELATGITTPAHITIGIRSDGTGETNNRVYNNEFTGIDIGNLGNRQNRNSTQAIATGLSYECNDNTDNTFYDFAVTEPDMSDPQYAMAGIRKNQGSLTTAAGNTFCFTGGESDFGDYTGKDVFYYYKTSSTYLPPQFYTYNVIPLPQANQENTCANNYSFPSESNPNGGGCATCISFSGYSAAFSQHKAAHTNYLAAFMALIDGGSIAARMQMVDTISNGNRLKDSLLSYSPNLSSVVLDKTARKGILNDTMKYEVMKQNAEGLNAEIMDYLKNRLNMPGWMLDSIQAARSILSYRSYLADTVQHHQAQKEYAAQNALRAIVEDSAGLNLTLYRQWLDSTDNAWAKKEKVNSYLHEGRLDTVAALLAHLDTTIYNTIADSISYANYKAYVLGYKAWIETDSSVMRFGGSHLQELKGIAALNEHSKGSQRARSVLNFFYDSAYFTPPMLPEVQYGKTDGSDAIVYQPKAAEKQVAKPTVKIYPNPATNSVTVEYSGLEANANLLITNSLGQILEQQRVIETTGKLFLNTTDYQSGVYIIRINTGSEIAMKSKFIIYK